MKMDKVYVDRLVCASTWSPPRVLTVDSTGWRAGPTSLCRFTGVRLCFRLGFQNFRANSPVSLHCYIYITRLIFFMMWWHCQTYMKISTCCLAKTMKDEAKLGHVVDNPSILQQQLMKPFTPSLYVQLQHCIYTPGSQGAISHSINLCSV